MQKHAQGIHFRLIKNLIFLNFFLENGMQVLQLIVK